MVNGEILKRLLHQQLSKSLSFGEGFRVRSKGCKVRYKRILIAMTSLQAEINLE